MANGRWKDGKLSKRFPRGFFWGAATSAYQVEGGNNNSDWESLNKLGINDIRGAGAACDHYHRFEEDFDLLKNLNLNAYRFSIEWARIEPERGEFDEREIEHYRRVLKALRERGIRPLATLHHFTNPMWLSSRGGWENPDVINRFGRYTRYVVTQLSDLCDFWVTINEPWVYISEGYLYRRWPPKKFAPALAYRVGKNMMEAHWRAYHIIHGIQPEAMAGLAYSSSYLRTPFGQKLPTTSLWERSFISWAGIQDFIGLNYYRSKTVKLPGFRGGGDLVTTDLGWEVCPEGLYRILMELKRRRLPIFITENGLADAKDKKRADYIRRHLAAVWRAIRDGADVRGYFHWSLMDNFEWAHGFGPRCQFGLAEVDFQTMKRRVRPSAKIYAKIAQRNSL